MAAIGKFETMAIAVAGGQTICSAAEAIGVSRRAGYRLSVDPRFRTRVAELRTEMTNQAIGRLSSLAGDAVDELGKIMKDQDARPSDRIAAAKAILSTLAPLSELLELRGRVDQLEAIARQSNVTS